MMAPEPAALPDDVLAEVLRRLPPLVLAASRRVCRAWRDAVDARLRGQLLSRSVRGIFINYMAHRHCSEFFSRPSTGPAICGGLDFLPTRLVRVVDHCHGLLLCGDREREYVVNPATRRWARLPRRPPPHMPGFGQRAYLAFDPAVSPHYEVFVIPRLPTASESDEEEEDDDALLESEWPPASYVVHVFSSMADRWERKTFLREGEAAGIVADMDSDQWYDGYHAVYWRSALYIHSQRGYLTIMSLTNHTYRVIRLPGTDELSGYRSYNVGRSVGGVYCAIQQNGLELWHLDESRDQTEWVLKHDVDLESFARKFLPLYYHKRFGEDPALQMGRPWILQDVNHRKACEEFSRDGKSKYGAPPEEEKYDWNSDEDNVLDIEDAEEGYGGHCHFLGFHPYKEIVYLDFCMGRGVAYNWSSSRFQYLGRLEPQDYQYGVDGFDASFAYTPCWLGEFPGNELETRLEDEEIARKKLELETQLEDTSNFTCVDEYELRKLRGRAKRVKDSANKTRRRHRIAGR